MNGSVIEPNEGAFCKSCGQIRIISTVMIYKLQIFCENRECKDFVRAIWVDRATYEMGEG